MSDLSTSQGPGSLIVHCGHHRCGTVWFDRIFRRLRDRLQLVYHRSAQADLPNTADLFFQDHSQLDKDVLPPFRGSHIRRDPRDLIISAYHYHLWADEAWLHAARDNLNGASYQQQLRSLDPEDGLLFEMERSSRHNINLMLAWDYRDERVLEIVYEELIADEEAVFDRLFAHYQFSGEAHRTAMETALSQTFQRVAKRPIGEVRQGSHMRSGAASQWREVFTPRHVDHFNRLFADALDRLGYGWE
ncbi:MAG: sulfotransferase domain-containing protein [Alphaproteobacteria bacterium]|nr:sulfotransferase domain-containing protein [Alphaproteobacteria bacterium]